MADTPQSATPAWQVVDSADALSTALAQAPAALVLWGGAHCGVCQAIKPQLQAMAAQHFAQLPLYYVDCANAPDACAQRGVFTLPVLRLYVQGKLALDYARVFSLQQVQAEVQRQWQLLQTLQPLQNP